MTKMSRKMEYAASASDYAAAYSNCVSMSGSYSSNMISIIMGAVIVASIFVIALISVVGLISVVSLISVLVLVNIVVGLIVINPPNRIIQNR